MVKTPVTEVMTAFQAFGVEKSVSPSRVHASVFTKQHWLEES